MENTTAATIPLAMQTALDDGRLKKGELVLLAGSVGAGVYDWGDAAPMGVLKEGKAIDRGGPSGAAFVFPGKKRNCGGI